MPKVKKDVPAAKYVKIDGEKVEVNSVVITDGTGVARNHVAIREPLTVGKSLVPSMKAINKKKKDFTSISLFAGCGGASVGMKMAGMNVLYSNEFIPAALQTYKANHPDTFVDGSDVRTLEPKKILKQLGLKRGELDHLDMSPPCFVPRTMINTRSGFKSIEDVCVGDEVLTRTQEFRRVYDTMVRLYKGTMYRIKTMSSGATEATPEHPYYVRRKAETCRANKSTLGEPMWVEAQDLRKGDYVGIATNQLSESCPWDGFDDVRTKRPDLRDYSYQWKNEQVLYRHLNSLPTDSKDFWWVVGRFVGDGWITHKDEPDHTNPRKRVKRLVRICCDKTDGGLELNQICDKLDSCGFSYQVKEARTSYKIRITESRELREFLLQFGQGAKNKRVPGFVMSMPKSLILRFVQGYISADGNRRGHGHFRFSTVSRELVYGMTHCINKVFGISTGKIGCLTAERQRGYGCNIIEGRECNVSDRYSAEFRLFAEQSKTHYVRDDSGIIWVPVKSVEAFDYDGPVHNFSVEEDETYTANNIIVHNCKGFSSAGVREDGWNKEVLYSDGVKQRVDDLFDQGIRMLKGFKPKTFTAENVSGLVRGISRGLFNETMRDFKAAGYRVKAAMIEPVMLGVPQTRARMIFIGVRNDLKMEPQFPKPRNKPPVRVKDVLPNVLYIKTSVKGRLTYIPSDRPSPTIVASDYDTGENAQFSCGGWCEDDQGRRRKYTLAELRRIMCFPDDFLLTGNPRQQWERLGRSHVPLQVYHLTKAIRKHVLEPYYDSKNAAYTDTIT
jgi:site-specific DNA-cytosine methylase